MNSTDYKKYQKEEDAPNRSWPHTLHTVYSVTNTSLKLYIVIVEPKPLFLGHPLFSRMYSIFSI